jgi:endonuclease-3 related protein
MIGAILTQNTSWRNVSTVIKKIRAADLLDPKKLDANHRRIPALIKASGFYRMKSRYLKVFLRYYVGEYNGSVNRMKTKRTNILRNELLSLPGIGQETADAILLYALKKRTFVVDAYTRRIFSRHKIFGFEQPYEVIQKTIENNLPASTKIFNEYHALLVKTGKEYCRKNDPLCRACPLGTMLSTSR